jgi:signal transduction histidine kinase
VALLAFGEQLLTRERYRRTTDWHRTLGAIALYVIASIGARLVYHLNDTEWALAVDVIARYSLGILGTVLASFALLQQRTTFRQRGMQRYVSDLNVAITALLFYGVIGQFFAPKSLIFPSTVINGDLFRHTVGFPVQLFRAVMAFIVTVSMIRVLHALEAESQEQFDSIRRAKLEAERISRDELARLNVELQAANQVAERLLLEVQQREALRSELLQRITIAQENERKRIARELHDGTGQALTGLTLGLRGILNVLREDTPEALAPRLGQLAELESMAVDSLGELRRLIQDLRPPQLDDMGLVAALRWLVEQFNRRELGLVELDVLGKAYSLPPEVETTLFRIVQEGMTNIAKHARAPHAKITLNFDGGVAVIIWDDGIGFDPAVQSNTPRWGLMGMQERASLINAELTIVSARGKGTTLTILLAEARDHADTSRHSG